jgi:hypothetical protein
MECRPRPDERLVALLRDLFQPREQSVELRTRRVDHARVDEPRVASGLAQPQQCLEHVHPDLRDAHAVDLLEQAVTI